MCVCLHVYIYITCVLSVQRCQIGVTGHLELLESHMSVNQHGDAENHTQVLLQEQCLLLNAKPSILPQNNDTLTKDINQ